MMQTEIRTPKQVIALVSPDKASEIEILLVKALQSASDNETHEAIIMVKNGELVWGTHFFR